jgi:hypothetical protein
MSVRSVQELKHTLLQAGFEVFRTLGSRVVLADRVRENLIMDSCVSVVCEDALGVRVVIRAQGIDFPGETEEQLFERVLQHGAGLGQRGYQEVERSVVPMLDPSDPTKRLDTWYEVSFGRMLPTDHDLGGELQFALAFSKVVV